MKPFLFFLFLASICVQGVSVAQDFSMNIASGSYPSNGYPIATYDSPDYYYNATYDYGNLQGGYRGEGGILQFGRSYNNAENFSSGVSSYQGTSTGPGPNGGYPGTPRGNYTTKYVNPSIYPNSYLALPAR